MNKERDLLPWILGGLGAATIVVAFASVSAHRDTATPVQAPAVLAAQPAVQAPVFAPALPAPATGQSPPPNAVLDSAPGTAPEAQTGQIWECTTKGVKTFSNNPCGEKSTLLEVSPINTMSATPVIHYARAYGSEPRYAPASAQGASGGDEPYSEDHDVEAGGNSYTIVQGVGLLARRRPEHSHRLPPRHNSGHVSAPAQRW